MAGLWKTLFPIPTKQLGSQIQWGQSLSSLLGFDALYAGMEREHNVVWGNLRGIESLPHCHSHSNAMIMAFGHQQQQKRHSAAVGNRTVYFSVLLLQREDKTLQLVRTIPTRDRDGDDWCSIVGALL